MPRMLKFLLGVGIMLTGAWWTLLAWGTIELVGLLAG